jgi:hypothetical protein
MSGTGTVMTLPAESFSDFSGYELNDNEFQPTATLHVDMTTCTVYTHVEQIDPEMDNEDHGWPFDLPTYWDAVS